MTKKKPKDGLLPSKKNAPKKTGKALKPPEDKKDLEEQAGKLSTIVTKQTDTGSLQADNPPKPKVVGERFQVFYLKPRFEKTPKGRLYVRLPFTVTMEKEHKELMPSIVASGYTDLMKVGRSGMKLKNIPSQRAEIFPAHDSKSPALFLSAARVTFANLALIQRKGEGVARRVIRFAFSLEIPIPAQADSDPVSHFAERNIQNTFWMKWEGTDQNLFDEGDEPDDEPEGEE
jgi:hypothetical protein